MTGLAHSHDKWSFDNFEFLLKINNFANEFLISKYFDDYLFSQNYIPFNTNKVENFFEKFSSIKKFRNENKRIS